MKSFLAAVLVFAFAANPALAASKTKDKKPKEPVAKVACWQRVYSTADLKKHRRQKVAMVQLTLETQGDGAVSAELGLNLRKRNGTSKYDYGVSSSCQPSGQTMNCAPEWNAGSFVLEKGARGGLRVKNRKLLVNPYGDNTAKVSSKAVNFRKSDDAIWLLFPADPKVCAVQ
jgi:opacity protein-like surface antigen